MKAGDVLAAMRALPLGTLDQIDRRAPSLILAPHPDDESLGCGGLIAASCAVGRPPLVVILTDGAGSHPGSRAWPPARLAAIRKTEAEAAVAILGVPPGHLHFLGVADTAAPHEGPAFDAAAARIAALAHASGCRTILAPWRHDPHGDHGAATKMAAAAAIATGARLVEYPVWGLTLPAEAWLPDIPPAGLRLDVTAHLDTKRRAIRAHASQYAGLITDDPAGFQMDAGFLALFDTPSETYLFA